MPHLSIIYFLTIILCMIMAAILATLAWSRRGTRGAVPFALAMAFVLLATLNRLLFVLAPEDSIYFFARGRIAALAFVPAFFTLFTLAYTGHRRWAAPARAWVFLVVPIAVSVLIFAQDQWFWSQWRIITVDGVRNEVFETTLLWRINLLYAYACFIGTLGLLLRAFLTSLRPLRLQALLLLIGWSIIILSNMPFAIAALGRSIPNLTNVGFVIGGMLFLAALRRQGLLDRVPLALQMVYQSMQDGVVVFDVSRRVVAMNPTAEAYFARTTDQIAGKTVAEALAIRPDLVAQFGALGDVSHSEVSHDGRTFDFDITQIIDHGELSGHVLVVRDITERKHAQQQALELTLEQERIRLLAGVVRDTSRELHTPLKAINAAVFQAQRATTAHERKERLSEIETQAVSMTQIIDALQLLADLDLRPSLTLSEFSVRDWLETLPNSICEVIERRKHRLVRDFDRAAPVTLSGDFYLLRAALQQLLQNAALYTPDGGTITLRSIQSGDSLEVTVLDTGVGIAPEALDAIFQRFTKLDAPRTTARGVGIGLAIVKKVVELHGGSVSATSELGKGSAFTMRLPLRPKMPAAPAASGDATQSRRPKAAQKSGQESG